MKAGISVVFLTFWTLFLILDNREKTSNNNVSAISMQHLLEGNKRFANKHSLHPHKSRIRIHEIATGQHPSVAIISCSDSRVPPEIIFDQGLGDMFVVRTAGNLMGELELGSLEYAVAHLGVKQIIVLGHKECGAIKAFISGGHTPGHIKDIVDCISKEDEIRRLPADDKNLLDDCIRANILHGMHQLTAQSSIIAEKISGNKLEITGACYDLQKGLVELVKE